MTEAFYLAAVRESYDTVAAAYADLVKAPAELDPLSRAMLAAFTEVVQAAGLGPVADVGCGPGKVTAHLAELGVRAFGIDLSPQMVELARRAYPSMHFTVGSMTALPIGDNELGGILAYYSMAGHVGDGERVCPTQAYGGHPVSYESHLLPTDRIVGLLERAGLVITAQLVEEPGEGAKRRAATFRASKPERP